MKGIKDGNKVEKLVEQVNIDNIVEAFIDQKVKVLYVNAKENFEVSCVLVLLFIEENIDGDLFNVAVLGTPDQKKRRSP